MKKNPEQGPGPSPLAPASIDLRAADIARLTEIAAAHGSTARAGANYGRPSWRALVKDIATGRLVVVPAGDNAGAKLRAVAAAARFVNPEVEWLRQDALEAWDARAKEPNALATLEYMAPVAIWRGSYAKSHPEHPGEPLVTLSAMDMDGCEVGEELARGRTLEAAILAL